MSEEKIHEEELTRGEETGEEEAVRRDGETEEAEIEEIVLEEAVQKVEQPEETAQKEETIGETIREEGEAVLETVQKEEDPAEELIWEAEEAEEIIYTEGEGMEPMTEQDYGTVDGNQLETEHFEEAPKKRGFFRRNKEEEHFLRDKWILSRIRDEDLMDYLVLEQKRNEQLQEARDIRERRIVSAFKLTVSLAAGVAVVYFLKDNPTIFVNVLYIGGILGGFWFWKNPREK